MQISPSFLVTFQLILENRIVVVPLSNKYIFFSIKLYPLNPKFVFHRTIIFCVQSHFCVHSSLIMIVPKWPLEGFVWKRYHIPIIMGDVCLLKCLLLYSEYDTNPIQCQHYHRAYNHALKLKIKRLRDFSKIVPIAYATFSSDTLV